MGEIGVAGGADGNYFRFKGFCSGKLLIDSRYGFNGGYAVDFKRRSGKRDLVHAQRRFTEAESLRDREFIALVYLLDEIEFLRYKLVKVDGNICF